jgi:hypothetical protein
MKIQTALIVCILLCGCISYNSDQRVVGRFKAPTGEVVVIRKDGLIVLQSDTKEERVGLVSISKNDPLTIHVLAPDTSPLVGTVIVFSENRNQIEVDWKSAVRPAASIPGIFIRE